MGSGSTGSNPVFPTITPYLHLEQVVSLLNLLRKNKTLYLFFRTPPKNVYILFLFASLGIITLTPLFQSGLRT